MIYPIFMTQKLRLHYAPDNASLCVRMAMEELGLTYATALVDRRGAGQRSEAYLALNPMGLIPVLETEDGPMFETGAILLWLAERQGKMMPDPTDPARALALQWLVWLSNTLHPTLRMLFYPEHYGASDQTNARTRERLVELLEILEHSASTPWLDSNEPSIHACYLGPMLRWCALYGGDTSWFDLSDFRRLHTFAKRLENRAAAAKFAELEGLGPRPFSKPQRPNPPEGSAL